MARTFHAIIDGDRIEWIGAAPEAGYPIEVRVSVPEPAPRAMTVDERRARLSVVMERLSASNPFGDIVDPVAWQREIRTDRPLPGREDAE